MGVAMHAAGLGPTFFEEVYLSLPRTYPINTSDLLTAVVYENGHRFTRFQGRMKKLLGTIDADRKTAAPPLHSKLQGPPTCGQFWTKGDSVVPE